MNILRPKKTSFECIIETTISKSVIQKRKEFWKEKIKNLEQEIPTQYLSQYKKACKSVWDNYISKDKSIQKIGYKLSKTSIRKHQLDLRNERRNRIGKV